MHRLVLTLSCAVALAAAPAVAYAATAPAAQGNAAAKAEPTKTATGTVTSVAGSSVTVKTSSGDMTFNIDQKTRVIERGGGTKARAAEAEGKPGVAATDLLKAGQNVDVKYHETGMHAATIRVIGPAPAPSKTGTAGAAASGGEGAPKPPKPEPPKAQTASGTVSAVAGNSLTVKSAGGDSTFMVDEKTTVVGTGMGTAGRKVVAAGGKPTLSEFVKEGDTVSVTYKEDAGAKHASVIRITRKKP